MIVCVDIWCEPTITDIKFNDYKRNPLIASTVYGEVACVILLKPIISFFSKLLYFMILCDRIN